MSLACKVLACVLVAVIAASVGRADAGEDNTSPNYEFDVVLEPAARHLSATGTFTVAAAKEKRSSLRLVVGDTFADSMKFSIVAPESIAGPLTWKKETFGRVIAGEAFARGPIPAGAPVTIAFSYAGGDKGDPVGMFQLDPAGSFASGSVFIWYPQIILPKVLNPPVVGSVRYRVVGPETLVGSGADITDDVDRRDGFRRFETRHPSHFGFAAARFIVRPAAPGSPISMYVLRPRKQIDRAERRIKQTMQLLQHWYGPYPQGEVKIIEAADHGRFGGGVGALLFVSSGSLDEAWDDAFYSHEISHAWFGGAFSTDLYAAIEGTANQAALQTIAELNGPAAARRFRMYGSPGYNELQSASGYLRLAAAGFDVPLIKHMDGGYAAQQISYAKGMLVWDMLRRHLGDERYNRIWRGIMSDRPFAMRPWEEVAVAFSRAAGEDLSWFFDQWLARTGAPDLALTWAQSAGKLSGKIEQKGDVYRLQVPIAVQLENGRRIERRIAVDDRQTTFALGVSGRARSVELDPDYTILRWTPEFHTLAEAMIPWTKAFVTDEYANGIEVLKQSIGRIPADDAYGLAFALNSGLGRLYALNKQWPQSVAAYRAAWDASSGRIDRAPWVLIRMADAAEKAGDRQTQAWALNTAREIDAKGPPSMLGEAAELRLERLK